MSETVPHPNNPFVLAHISDVHLGPLPGLPLALANPKRLAGTLNWYRKRRHVHRPETADAVARDVVDQRPDHIAVTGDLTNLGLAAEIGRSAAWLGRLGDAPDVSVIPGNHDIYSTMHGQRLGVSALGPWAAFFAPCEAGRQILGSAEPFPFVRVLAKGGVQIALIGLNSAVETPPLIATGALGSAQRDALARILDVTGRSGFVRVVMLHHPPLTGLSSRHHELTDAAALTDVLRMHGAELVLHGHNHRRMINTLSGPDGPIPIVGVPSASAARSHRGEPLARAHFYEFRCAPGARAQITLVARGLSAGGGAITEIERTRL